MAAAVDRAIDAKMARKPGTAPIVIFSVVLLGGLIYALTHLISDLSVVQTTSIRPFIFLAGALLIALGFEFVNGFHDTANAVATVIYTHSLEPHIAVAWSGFWNFLNSIKFEIRESYDGGLHPTQLHNS
jgi:inorganic phosphate transporter, PiT family